MAIFGSFLPKQVQRNHMDQLLLILLHSFLLVLCIIGSILFVQELFEEQPFEGLRPDDVYRFWSFDYFMAKIIRFVQFIKIKVLIPILILAYFTYCLKRNVFQNLFKQHYKQKYNAKYSKLHRLEPVQDKQKQSENEISINQSEPSGTNLFSFTQNQTATPKEIDQSLNMSMSIVKSMNRSMMSSIRSINGAAPNIPPKSQLSIRSSKVLQNLSKKTIQPQSRGKDLMTLIDKDKGKNVSDSFISQSSSGLEGQDGKVRIRNKKYYESITQKQANQFKRWYDQANSLYAQEIKDNKFYAGELMQMKRGLEKDLNLFVKQYNQNKQNIKDCLTKYWSLKIEGYEGKKYLRQGLELINLFVQKQDNLMATKGKNNDISKSQQVIFKPSSSPKQFINHILSLKVPFRTQNSKIQAQNELSQLLSRRAFFNTLLNICSVNDSLFSQLETKKFKMIEKALALISSNKLQIFSLRRSDDEFFEIDLLEEEEIDKIKEIAEIRILLLQFVVNKINLMSSQRCFKVKMKEAVTYHSGYLTTALQFFQNKHFAEIVSEKTVENVFTHFNLKVHFIKDENKAQKLIHCKPGIDNSISVLFFLARQLSNYFSTAHRFADDSNYDCYRKQQGLKEFIEDLYPKKKF